MSVLSTDNLHRLDAILYQRQAGRNIIDYAIETINDLRQQRADRDKRIAALERDLKNAEFRKTWDETNAQWRASKEYEELSLKAKAWDALVAWRTAERKPDATENEVFPLILAYEKAAKAAGWQ